MSKTMQEVQKIRSLRKDLRDPTLSIHIHDAIEKVHACIRVGTDTNGWKKVEWRSSGHNSNSEYQRNGIASGTNGINSKSSFFGNRSSGQSGMNRKGQNYSSFKSNDNTSRNSNVSSAHNNAHAGSGTTTTITSHPPAKYVSIFKKESEKVDDTILNTIVLGKLNKFSSANYNEIKEFIMHIIDSGQNDMIRCFMKLVFQKAACEEMFCPLYAKMLSELTTSYPILLTEMSTLYKEYIDIFEEVLEDDTKNYSEFLKRNVEKKYRRGYSQFLAELIKHDVSDSEVFLKTISTIVKQIELSKYNAGSTQLIEEYADCLNKIINAIGSNDDMEDNEEVDLICKYIKDTVYNRLHPLTVKNKDNKGVSTKARFAILDIYEKIEKL